MRCHRQLPCLRCISHRPRDKQRGREGVRTSKYHLFEVRVLVATLHLHRRRRLTAKAMPLCVLLAMKSSARGEPLTMPKKGAKAGASSLDDMLLSFEVEARCREVCSAGDGERRRRRWSWLAATATSSRKLPRPHGPVRRHYGHLYAAMPPRLVDIVLCSPPRPGSPLLLPCHPARVAVAPDFPQPSLGCPHPTPPGPVTRLFTLAHPAAPSTAIPPRRMPRDC